MADSFQEREEGGGAAALGKLMAKPEELLVSFEQWKAWFVNNKSMILNVVPNEYALVQDFKYWRKNKVREVLMDLRLLTCPELW